MDSQKAKRGGFPPLLAIGMPCGGYRVALKVAVPTVPEALRPTIVPAMPPTGLLVVVTKLPFTVTLVAAEMLPLVSVPPKLAVLGTSATVPVTAPVLPFWPLEMAVKVPFWLAKFQPMLTEPPNTPPCGELAAKLPL